MQRLAVAFALVLSLVSFGCKKDAPSPPEVATAAPPEIATAAPEAPAKKAAGRPFLYRVEAQGDAKGSGWLLGTIHMGGDPDEDLHPLVWQRFDSATTVVLEADVGSIGPMQAARMAMLPEGESLQAKLTPAQWAKLDDMSGLFVPSSSLDRMKPAFALALVVKELLPKTDPMDLVIQRRAKAADKPLAFLETIDEQVKMLDEAIDAEVLGFSLDHADEMKERLDAMVEAYLLGDEPKLTASAFDPDEMKAHPEMFEKLFFRRNAAWVPRLRALFAKGGGFVAVGAGHLVGDRSVVALLREAGYQVTRETID